MADQQRPADDGCRDGFDDPHLREPAGSDRQEQTRRGPQGGSGLVTLAIIMLLAVAGLLGLWWWTQRKDVSDTPPAAEEQADEAADSADDPDNGLDIIDKIPGFRGGDEAESDAPDEATPADERPSGEQESSRQDGGQRDAPQNDPDREAREGVPDRGESQQDASTPGDPDQPDADGPR